MLRLDRELANRFRLSEARAPRESFARRLAGAGEEGSGAAGGWGAEGRVFNPVMD